MKVLIACEFSGKVREAFKSKGHDAWSCDILPTEIPGKHLHCDVLTVLNHGWDMLIGFPPCTDIAISGARHFKQKRLDGRQQMSVDFFMNLINAPIDRIVIENPVGVMSTLYRKPDQIIQPFQFGDPVPKKTCLWLKNLPLLRCTNIVTPEYIVYNSKKSKSGKSHYSIFGRMGKGHGKERSITFSGIANAM